MTILNTRSQGTTIGNGRITQNVSFNSINQVFNPWSFFTTFFKNQILNAIINIESSFFPESKHNLLRESAIVYPGVGPSSLRSVKETRAISTIKLIDEKPKVNITDSNLERDRFSIALTPLIWIASIVYATDDVYRSKFTSLAISNGFVPQFTTEIFKRTRSSLCGVFKIVPSLSKVSFKMLLKKNSQFKNTFWDPDFLLSDTGLNAFYTFLSFLKNSPGNYVPMTQASSQSLPPLEATFTTTFGALVKSPTMANFTLTLINVISGNSYGAVVPETHIMDANIMNVFIKQHRYAKAVNITSPAFDVSISMLGAASYIVSRVTGLEPNPTSKPPGSQDSGPDNGDVSVKIDNTPKQPNLGTPAEGISKPKSRNFRNKKSSVKVNSLTESALASLMHSIASIVLRYARASDPKLLTQLVN